MYRATCLLLSSLLVLGTNSCDLPRLGTRQETSDVPCLPGVYLGQPLKELSQRHPNVRFEASINGFVENLSQNACGLSHATYYFKRDSLSRVVLVFPQSLIESHEEFRTDVKKFIFSPSCGLGRPDELALFPQLRGLSESLWFVVLLWNREAWEATLQFPSADALAKEKEGGVTLLPRGFTIAFTKPHADQKIRDRLDFSAENEISIPYRVYFMEH